MFVYSRIYLYDWKIYSINNKSTKTIQVQLYTTAKKEKRHEMHIFKGRVKGKARKEYDGGHLDSNC